MNKMLSILFLLSFQAGAQCLLTSGQYREMNIAYNKDTKVITGLYENYTGYDEKTNLPQFSCIFYFEGKLFTDKIKIKSYYPLDYMKDTIIGELMVINNKEIKFNIPKEHGGFWNVEHFADEPLDFTLDKAESWIEIRYANIDMVHFYSEKAEITKQKAYLVKGDILYIDKIEGNWAFGSYRAKQTTKGWIKLSEFNHLD